MYSNMKILTPTAPQQNVSHTSPPTLSQQSQVVPTGEGVCSGGVSSSKEFTSNHGGSSQKSSKRDQHQKHNGAPNKSKFTHGNGGNKMQLSLQHQQQQKYHHSSGGNGNKNKKHYNGGGNNSTSSLNRKKFYQQQQQNPLPQLHYHHHHHHHHPPPPHQQQSQYLSTAMPPNQQKISPSANTSSTSTTINNDNTSNYTNGTTSASSNTNVSSNNNNCLLVKNQNFTSTDLMQNPIGNNNQKNTNTRANTITTTPHSVNSMSSSTVTTETDCSIQSNDCDNLSSSSTELEYLHQQHHHQQQLNNTTSTEKLQQRLTTTITNFHNIPAAPTGGCKCSTKFAKISQPTTAAIIKTNKNKNAVSVSADSLGINRQYFFETEPPTSCKCTCGQSSSSSNLAAQANTNSTHTQQSKKKTWKNSNCSCCDGNGGGRSCDTSCSASPISSNDNVNHTDKLGTKRCDCSCSSLSYNNSTHGSNCFNNAQRKPQQEKVSVHPSTDKMNSAIFSTNATITARNVSNNSANALISDISSTSSTENSFVTSSPSAKQKCTNPPVTVETSQIKNNDSESKLVSTINGSISCADSSLNRAGDCKTSSRSSATGHPSPNSYSLDFLHSVGVQMTGGVKLDGVNNVANNMRPIIAGTSPYGSHATAENSPARSPYPYPGIAINQRQQRYVFGGGSSQQQHSYQQHHHHHQPTQLTIASFLQKDILGENFISSCNSSSGGAGSTNQTSQSNNATINNYSDQQTTQHHFARAQGRYYNNYYHTPHYHQQQAPGQLHSCSYGNNNGTVDADLARFATNVGNQRPPAYNGSGYLNYNHTGSNNSLQYTSQMQPNQEPNRTRTPQSGYGSGGCDTGNAASKKSCSSASSCSSSSSSSSNSSSGSNRKQQQQQSSTQNSQQKQLSTLNLAIETLPPKTNGQQSGGQRQGHRGHHHHGHGNHHHQNHYGHHHHQLSNTPSTPQHQNYYNLTYVSTDGTSGATSASISGTNSRGCSPAPILPPTPSSSNPSPKSLENCPGAVAMMANLHLTTASTQINYSRYPQSSAVQQFQQQQYLNKKLLAPLTLSVPSPSPSPTPTHISGTLPPQASSLGPGPHNIICCSQLDEASTAAAAAAAKSGIIAGNDYDSDASSTHSSAVSNATQSRKYQTFKSLSISSSSSATSLCQQECKSQPGTPADVSASNTPLGSPMGYNAYASTFPNLQTSSTSGTQQTYLNHPHVLTKSSNATIAGTATQLPHVYNNGVISMLNLPSQSTASNCEGSCTNYMEEDYQQRQQPPHFFLGASSAQSSGEQLNIVSALSASTSRSNSSSGYWSPSHQCSFLYHQLSSSSSTSAPATSIMVAPHTPSCGSSSSSISPGLTDRDDHKSQQHLHKQMSSSGTSSPSITCSSCLNEQLGITPEGCSSTNSTSSNSSLSGRGNNNYATSSESGSTQLLMQQQQRLIAQQTQHSCSPSLSMSSNSTASSIPSVQRTRSSGNNRNHQYLQNHSLMASSSMNGNNAQQTVLPHMFPHQQLQSLPPPPPPHNLLYNNPQAHHLRTLRNSSVHDFFTHTPPDRFLARAHLIEAKEAPASLLNNSKWDNLSQDIWSKFISCQQTEETFKQKMRLWRFLYLFIKNAYPRYGLYLVGSTISGFGSDTSDVDMCLVSRSASNIDPRMEALFNLTVLRDCLSKSGEFEYFNLIEAKVPILRFRDRVHQLEVDLNFNNCVGIKNTHLLYCYSQLDWRLRPLVLVTKLWAQHHNINNAKNMTISSYSLVLMVIHFLQYAVSPPVLPCLHDLYPEKFPFLRSNDIGYVDMNETIGPHESKNIQTVGELFLKFLEYYSNFDYSQHAISVRTGGVLPINVCRTAKSLKNDIHQWKELCIEEPFDRTNTARSVYDYETFERVKAVFVASWQVLKETLDLNSVFMPITDTSQTSSISDEDHSVRADSKTLPPKDNIDNRALSWTEDPVIVDSCSTAKQMVKYRETKHIQTNCHNEMLYEPKVVPSVYRETSSNTSPPTFTSTPSSHSSSTTFASKHLNRNSNGTTALIS